MSTELVVNVTPAPWLEFLATTTGANSSELEPSAGAALDPVHVRSISQRQEQAGFDGVLVTETNTSAHAFVLGTQVLAATERMRVVVSARPGVTTPVSLHRAIATLDAFHPGRVGMYLPSVDNDAEYRREGDLSTRTERQQRRGEFLDVVDALSRPGPPVRHDGQHYRLDGAWTVLRPEHDVPVYLSGLSTAADELATRRADVYFVPSETANELAQRIARVRAATSRPIRFGLRLRPILGNRPNEARALAERVLRTQRSVDPGALARATGALGDARGLIGTPSQVAATLLGYAELGVTVFQLHGFEAAADVDRFAQLVAEVRSGAAALAEPASAEPVPA